jgi:hypothetical protein
MLRGVCRYAGVHLWTGGGDDFTAVGNGWITIHATRDGQRTIRLPESTGLYDLTDRRLVADDAREHRYFLKGGMTRSFCVGPVERLERLGLPDVHAAAPGRRRRSVTLPEEPTVEIEAQDSEPAAEDLDIPVNKDVETLRAVLSLDLSQAPILPDEDADEFMMTRARSGADDTAPREGVLEALGEVLANGRRRRRRGGRGRGRRKGAEGLPGESDGAATNGAAPEAPPTIDHPHVEPAGEPD